MSDLLKSLRAKADKGIILTLDEVKAFVAAARKSYSAAEASMKDKEKLSRNKKPATDEKQIDFF